MESETLSARLREIRQVTGLSAEDFAKVMGVSVSSVYKWENGTTISLSTQSIAHFAKVLNVNPNWLVLESETQRAIPGKEIPVLAKTEEEVKSMERNAMSQFHDLFIYSGLTITDLADLSGITRSALSLWINGKGELSFNCCFRLAQTLGCSMEYLVGMSDMFAYVYTQDKKGREHKYCVRADVMMSISPHAKNVICNGLAPSGFKRGKFDCLTTGNVIKRYVEEEMLKGVERFEIK